MNKTKTILVLHFFVFVSSAWSMDFRYFLRATDASNYYLEEKKKKKTYITWFEKSHNPVPPEYLCVKERNNVNYLANKKLIHIWFYSSENIDLFPFSTSSVLHQLEHTVYNDKDVLEIGIQ